MNTQIREENVIIEKKPPSDITLALEQIKSPLIYILLVAALLTWFLGDYIDTSVIFIAVLINTILGFIQERKAQKGLTALKKILTPTAKIVHAGRIHTVNAHTLRVNDIIVVNAGDRIPADGKLTEAAHLFVNEAILTGESVPVEKTLIRDSEVYMGTVVSSGRGRFSVTDIGMHTKLGTIAETLEQTPQGVTPLQNQLSRLAKILAWVVGIICVIIFFIGITRGEPFVAMFSLAVAIAVSAIPEGMTVSLTVILSVGMQRILKRNAIVRRLVSAETLGSVSTLCIDKTGTLTEGVMRVVAKKITQSDKVVKACIFANNMENPIDIAMWEWAQAQNHCDPQEMTETEKRLHEIPFDGVKKYMAVENSQGIWIKGAPEILLSQSTLTTNERSLWMKQVDTYAHKGLRVIGVAHKNSVAKDRRDGNTYVSHCTFLGILGISDPVRQGVSETLSIAKRAGVEIKVVTGDYRLTSQAILKEVGIEITDASSEIMEGKELEDLSVDDLSERIHAIKLFCRVTPNQKLKIVDALQKRGDVVAMTGDGVNDALALKKADIGIVVANASDVAKENADVVLLDSNFRTIVGAIEEGRTMFQNIQKVVLYLLSDAFAEMFLITTSIVLHIPLPLTAIQILWINILSDGFPNLALSMEPKEHDVMRIKPLPRSTPIVNGEIALLIIVVSFFKALFTFIAFMTALGKTSDIIYAQTLAFAVIGSGSLIYAFSTRNLSRSVMSMNPFKNIWLVIAVIAGFVLQTLVIYQPALQHIFHTYPLGGFDWVVVVTSGMLLILIIECVKYLYNRKAYLHRKG
jgi:Ca2+-transporting ATPase